MLDLNDDFKKLIILAKITNIFKTYALLFNVSSLFCIYVAAFLLRLNLFNSIYRPNISKFIEVTAMLISIFSLISIIAIITYDEQKNKVGLKIKKFIDMQSQELVLMRLSCSQNEQLEKLHVMHRNLVLSNISRVVHYLNCFAALVFVIMEVLAVIELYRGYGFSVLHKKLNIPLTFHSLIDTIGLIIFTISSIITLTNAVLVVYEKSKLNSSHHESRGKKVRQYFNRTVIIASIALVTTVLHLVGRIFCGLESANTISIPYGNGILSIGFIIRIVSALIFISCVTLIPMYSNMNNSEYEKLGLSGSILPELNLSVPDVTLVRKSSTDIGGYTEAGMALLSI